MAGWKVLPIDVNINVCEIHRNRLKPLIHSMTYVEGGRIRGCDVNRCHERASFRISVRLQDGVWEVETKKEGF